MVLNKRIFRMMRENFGRYTGIILLIFFASFTLVVMGGIGQNLGRLLTSFAENNRQEDISFTTDYPISDIGEIERELGLSMEDFISMDVELSQSQTLRLISPNQKINIPALNEGQDLSSSGQILLENLYAEANGYLPGSTIEINGKTFTVTGLISLPNYIYPLKNPFDILVSYSNFGVGIVGREDMEASGGYLRGYTVRFDDSNTSINQQAVILRERLENEGVNISDWIDNRNNKRMSVPWASVTGMQSMSIPIPIAMFLLCCIIVGIMNRRIIRAESVIIGTFYAQGYRRRELVRHYMVIPVLLPAIGGLSGVLLALPCLSPGVNAMLMYYNVPFTGIEWNVLHIALGVLLPIILMGVSSYFIIRRQLSQTPMELMKGDKHKTKVNALERVVNLEKFKFNTKYKLREQMRSISRLLFLLFGIMGASALMMLGFTIQNSLNHVFSSSTEGTYDFAYEYSFRQWHYGTAPEDAEVFSAEKFYPEGNEIMEFYVTGVQSDSEMIFLEDLNGNPLSVNQTIITRPLAERLKVGAGDTVSVIGKRDGKTYDFMIDAVSGTQAGQFIFMPIAELNIKLGLPKDAHIGYWSNIRLDIPGDQLSGMKSLEDVENAASEFMGPMLSAIIAMTASACIIGLIIIFLVTSLIIEESKKTISLFKIFGYKKKEVRSLVLGGTVYIVVVGFLLGIPLMALSMGGIYGYLGEQINMVLPVIVNPLYIIICFAAILLTYEVSKMMCARKVDRVAMSEALKSNAE
ncbi:FtsX-like permease family protein [Sedimentibacter hydroxybenzoicus DSM 7310]|uniref:FtsX-like permease family protein n=2 Tax=Sedimentibacter hydroxybenzoicus TaxID=29345 RepID=A0A974BM25_SEDHY|nr:FtsX-like permease family protein [Sedimentibacter hydroxybenzoicus DSM 7310]